MKNSILISKYIITLLKQNEDLTSLVGDRIYPIDAKQGTTFPFIVVRRQNITTEYNKDGISYDTVSFSVIVVAMNYIDSVIIAQEVRKSLELYRGAIDNNTNIKLIHFTGISEDLYNNAFVQQLTFDTIL